VGLRIASAREGVTAPSDGRWPPPKGATSVVRQLETQAEEPTLGAVLARRSGSVLGAAAAWAARIPQAIREAGWARLPRGESLGDGAPGRWTVAAADCPGGRQPRDAEPLSAHR
jgi:hypothetical protein